MQDHRVSSQYHHVKLEKKNQYVKELAERAQQQNTNINTIVIRALEQYFSPAETTMENPSKNESCAAASSVGQRKGLPPKNVSVSFQAYCSLMAISSYFEVKPEELFDQIIKEYKQKLEAIA